MLSASVVGRHVYYNRSAFDGRSAGADSRDDAAIAPEKSALLPGEAVSPANYTSYSRGLNGLMVDLADLPPGGRVTASDFEFRVGNDGNPWGWKPAPRPVVVTVRDLGDSSRVTVRWRDRAIRNAWLQVVVNPTANTDLPARDVFYFGNLIGDAGAGDAARVDSEDVALAQSALRQTSSLEGRVDFDRNGRVTRADVRAARRNLGAALYTAAPFPAVAAAPGAGFAPPALPGDWRLAFHDEFSGAALDPVWRTAQYWDREVTVVGEGELQAYDATGVSTSGGLLRLTARRDDRHGVPYVSGLVMTGGERAAPATPKFSFRYGYMEVRAKLPAGRGLWPAVWLMPASYDDDNGEIDVVELLGQDPSHAQFALHRNDGDLVRGWDGPNLSRGFHTFAVDWQPDYVAWYVDGVERARTTDRSLICPEAMYPILNLAVGGAAGSPNPSVLPASMDVDYIRVWQSGPESF